MNLKVMIYGYQPVSQVLFCEEELCCFFTETISDSMMFSVKLVKYMLDVRQFIIIVMIKIDDWILY